MSFITHNINILTKEWKKIILNCNNEELKSLIIHFRMYKLYNIFKFGNYDFTNSKVVIMYDNINSLKNYVNINVDNPESLSRQGCILLPTSLTPMDYQLWYNYIKSLVIYLDDLNKNLIWVFIDETFKKYIKKLLEYVCTGYFL